MLAKLKKRLYFVVAAYLGFWAKLVLRRWRPRIVVVTGSTGKTTVLHLLEAQIGNKAVYSHHANSALGLPFLILGMGPNVRHKLAWPIRLLLAPVHIFRPLPRQKIFVVEADCDRPHEGKFLAKLLKPEATLWVSVFRTHSMNFDSLVQNADFATHEEAIAYEFGHFIARTRKLVLANGDQPALVEQLERVKTGVEVKTFSLTDLAQYSVTKDKTIYDMGVLEISVPGLVPRELATGLQMVDALLEYLELPLDENYAKFHMPPGRSNVFKGKKDTTLVDSTYNTGLGASKAVMDLFEQLPVSPKWLVLGDILEQGSLEAEEHAKLAKIIADSSASQVVLIGPRTNAHTLPKLKKLKPSLPVVSFDRPDEVLAFLQENLKGGEAILFKGGRFLEGVIEQLLANPKDAKQLVRRERAWVKRRQKWGLPR